jgi:hypothetical protein
MRRTAFALSSSVRNQAFVGESGNRKLPIREWEKGLRVVRGAHKNDTAVMSVSIPVMIISLEEGKCIDEKLNLVVPLPWLKPSSMDMQCAKADETRDNLSCNVHECLRR